MPFDTDATMRAARILIDQDPGPGDRLDAYLLLAGHQFLWRGDGPGAERRHEVAVWLAGRFLGWLSSPTRRRCRAACDWRADDRVLIALGASHAMVRSEPPRPLDDTERRVTELALANVIAAPVADDARAETSERVDNRHSAYYGRP